MTNPFDDDSSTFFVLRDNEGHLSLWPAFAPIAAGWCAVHGPVTRRDAATYIEAEERSDSAG